MRIMKTRTSRFPLALGGLPLSALICLAAPGCGTDTPPSGRKLPPTQESVDFLSHLPGVSQDRSEDADGQNSSGDDGPANGDGDGDSSAPGASAERAIAEADIVQVDGNVLYALSEYSGLSAIDIEKPGDLRLLGNFRTSASPFEMYLEGDTAYVMFNGWYSYEYDEASDSFSWQSASRLVALNVSDPRHIALIGEYEVAGEISDSRKVGDVVYLATYENGYCYGCEQLPNTRVASFDASDPSHFQRIDQIAFTEESGSYGKRSISVTDERIFVSGESWNEGTTGSITVVDISDPSGKLKRGAEVPVAGPIQSRWQMDETDGVLRVISQPGGWGTDAPPRVETFRMDSAEAVVPLANLEMALPRPEALQSVRFDGKRAYAVTFERTDPLFTFDLSDPENPKQMGELEIPGWLYHMEPRGDLMYALGYDNGEGVDDLHVSLFDVSDLSSPKMLDREHFGGDWGSFAEDQDRIHKAFKILPEQNLILVPFTGGGRDEESCSYHYESGIQLVDIQEDGLELRGVAPQVGAARRAILHDQVLLGITDNAVQAFDIGNRDAPVELDRLDVARNVSSLRVMGSTLLRFGSDWWTGETALDFVPAETPESAAGLGQLDLSSLTSRTENYCGMEEGGGDYDYANGYFSGEVFVHGNKAFLPRHEYTQTNRSGKWTSEDRLTLFVIDLTERTALRLIDRIDLEPIVEQEEEDEDDVYSYESFGNIVQTDHALLIGRRSSTHNYDDPDKDEERLTYDVIDLRKEDPTVGARFEVPVDWTFGGYGYSYGGCGVDLDWGWYGGSIGAQVTLVSGDIVVSQHQVPVDDGTGRVRYFLDRIDVSDPANPELLAQVNIPGSAIDYDHESKQLVTVDHLLEERPADDWEDCYSDHGNVYFDDQAGVCRSFQRRVNVLTVGDGTATLLSRKNIEDEQPAQSVSMGDGLIFYDTINRDASGHVEQTFYTLKVEADGGLTELPAIENRQDGVSYWYTQVARGKRAFQIGNHKLHVIDATDDEPTMTTFDMPGWACDSLEVRDNVAYCAMGPYGVKAFALD